MCSFTQELGGRSDDPNLTIFVMVVSRIENHNMGVGSIIQTPQTYVGLAKIATCCKHAHFTKSERNTTWKTNMSPKKAAFSTIFQVTCCFFLWSRNIKKAVYTFHHLPFVSLQVLISTSEPVEAVLWAIYSAEETGKGTKRCK